MTLFQLEKYSFFSFITNIYPTIKLSIKLLFDWVHNLKPNWKTHLNLNRTQNKNSSSNYLEILQTHLQYLVMKTSPLFFLWKAALKYHINHIYFKWRGSLFLPIKHVTETVLPFMGTALRSTWVSGCDGSSFLKGFKAAYQLRDFTMNYWEK